MLNEVALRVWKRVPEEWRPAVRRARGQVSRLLAPYTRTRAMWGVGAFSVRWGWDRGLPIHRFYVERFMEKSSSLIRGHCLEFQEDLYATRFGKGIQKLDILHIDESNPKATIVADLTAPNEIPSDTFDCIICTHVLHVIKKYPAVVSEMHRILRPGGVLLVCVPQSSMCLPEYGELWRFTAEGMRTVLADVFGISSVVVESYGNSLVSAAELRGLVSEEFTRGELLRQDSRFALEVCARATKAAQ